MTKAPRRKCIALYTSYLCGPYLGELVLQIRQHAACEGLDVIIIMTSSFGEFDNPIALDHIDAAFIALNAVSQRFVEKLLNKGIPVVTNGDNYSNLNVDIIRSNQYDGIKQAYSHLYDLGHRKIGFIGDMSIKDFQIRFDALTSCYNDTGSIFDKSLLFEVNDPTLPGGIEAAEKYLASNDDCTAIICGTDLIALGLEQALKAYKIAIPHELAIIGVDNTKYGQTHSPSLTTIDQRLDLLVGAIVDRINARLNQENLPKIDITTKQELVIRQSSLPHGIQPSHSKENKVDESKSRDNIEALALSGTAIAVQGKGFNKLISLSKLWGPFFNWGCMALAIPKKGKNKDNYFEISDLFSSHKEFDNQFLEKIPANHFPPNRIDSHVIPEHSCRTIIPISPDVEQTNVLVIVDCLKENTEKEYGVFYHHLEQLVFHLQKSELSSSNKKNIQHAKNLSSKLDILAKLSKDAIFTLEIQSNRMEWSNRMLELLGFTNEIDIDIYRNMSLLSRVHDDDYEVVKSNLDEALYNKKPFNIKFRMKKSDDSYIWIQSNGQAIEQNEDGKEFFVSVMSDITEAKNNQRILKEIVNHDSLTGLPKRSLMVNYIRRRVYRYPNKSLAIFVFNINRFKEINSTYSHELGDKVLKKLAHSIQSNLKKRDKLYRLPSDEFALVCQVDSYKKAKTMAQKTLDSISSSFEHESNIIAISLSMGASVFPNNGNNANDLIKKASLAMQEAKQRKLDSPFFYTGKLDKGSSNLMCIEYNLRHAIENNELFLVIQPQINSKTGKLAGGEFLVRWQSSQFGLVPPSTFIPLAEKIGMIHHIGNWVLETGIKHIKEWKGKVGDNTKFSLNVSSMQLREKQFDNYIIKLVKKTKLPPHLLTLEITESAIIEDISRTTRQFKNIEAAGIQLSLDDFGTGYSSLSSLHQLPLHWVKLDRSFIRNLTEKDIEKGMAKSITDMCHSLGYRVVAEGVETKQQLDIVTKVGCDLIQGFYYSKPITLNEFEKQYLSQNIQMSA